MSDNTPPLDIDRLRRISDQLQEAGNGPIVSLFMARRIIDTKTESELERTRTWPTSEKMLEERIWSRGTATKWGAIRECRRWIDNKGNR